MYRYEYKHKKGPKVFGDNLLNIEFKENFIKLNTIDKIKGLINNEITYWTIILDTNELEYFKFWAMNKDGENNEL